MMGAGGGNGASAMIAVGPNPGGSQCRFRWRIAGLAIAVRTASGTRPWFGLSGQPGAAWCFNRLHFV